MMLPKSFKNRPQIVPGWSQNRCKKGFGKVWRAFRALREGVSAAFEARSQKNDAPEADPPYAFSVFGPFWEPQGEAKIDENREIWVFKIDSFSDTLPELIFDRFGLENGAKIGRKSR